MDRRDMHVPGSHTGLIPPDTRAGPQVHEPHPSLPQFYHNYTDAFGDPAGNYLGTITQARLVVGSAIGLLVAGSAEHQ